MKLTKSRLKEIIKEEIKNLTEKNKYKFVKKFKEYDLNAQILNWSTAVTRSRLLQEKYGFNKNILVYSHENLIKNTDIAMKAFANKLGIKIHAWVNCYILWSKNSIPIDKKHIYFILDRIIFL